MSDVTIFYETDALCSECSHSRGWHGVDTNGCSYLGTAGWCRCLVPFFTDHPITPDEDDPTTCLVCRRDLDMRLVHGSDGDCSCSGPDGWHCPGEHSEHWAQGDEPDADCGYCGSRPLGPE